MKKRITDISLIALTAVLLFSLGAGVFVPRESNFSEDENRMLADLRLPTVKAIADGSFSDNLSEVFRDRLPFRRILLQAKTYFELLLGKGESNGVVFAEDGYLLQKGEYEDYGIAERNMEYFSELEDICGEKDKPFVCALAPRGIDVMTDTLPKNYGGYSGKIWETAKASSAEYFDLTPSLRQAADNGKQVWYRTDHHWTSLGAYTAYAALSEKLGYTPYTEDYFYRETVSGNFLGSVYSLGGCVAFTSDSIELYRYDSDEDYTVEITECGETQVGFYFYDRLSEKDKYLIFLGGNYSELNVSKTDGEKREKLLLIKDSYANSLVPFLALHYDIELIDLRYYQGGRDELAKKISDADKILLLHGIDTVATTALY